MIAWIIRRSVANRFLVLMGALFLSIWGAWTVINTPVDALPDLSDVQVIIKTSYPGQAPQIVENQVTYPLTTTMLSVPGAKTVRGFSQFGDSYVYVIFEDGTDLYWARSRVLEYLNQVQGKLPSGASSAIGPDATGVGWIFEYALVDRSGKYDLAELRSLQDWFLKYELKTIPNVAEVASVGGVVKQYQILVDPIKLTQFGVSLQQVKQALDSSNQEAGGSSVEIAEAEYMVRANGYLTSLDDFNHIVLKTGENRVPVYLSDVARVQIGPEMRRGIAELNGEGEPGTFKDRVLLSHDPHKVFEGMTIAALAIGAHHGMLYLRGEYRYLLDSLHQVLQRRREMHLLGKSILGEVGFDFDIVIHVGAGAYVCGEESALIESLEGKRGTPRIRPPYPTEHGYLGQPTVVDNVETLCAATHVVLRGGAWWATIGTAKSTGSQLHSVSGDCERPGIYEYPMGVSVDQILQDCGARNTQAVQVGGPSDKCLSVVEFGRHIAFEDVPTAGAFMVLDRSRDMFDVAHNYARFFAEESCGLCTPCRIGTALVLKSMDKIAEGRGARSDVDLLLRIDTLMHGTAHCGLGGSACNALHDTLTKFRPAYEQRLHSLQFEPAFDLNAELAVARRWAGSSESSTHQEKSE